jgi:F-type H+-transporting ATPase subunit alpha
VGISVSRVGGSAQIKSMKKVAGTLKLDQAQYRELEAFAKFGSDLDAATQLIINRGKKNQEILKQPQYSPIPVGEQVAIIYASTKGFIDKVPVEKARAFQTEFISVMRTQHQGVLDQLSAGKFDDELTQKVGEVATHVAQSFVK